MSLFGDFSSLMVAPEAAGGVGLYGNHAYWRVFVTNNNGSASFISLPEVVFKDGAGSTVATSGGTVLFSTQANSSTDAAANAFDGNTTTPWTTSSGNVTNQYIGYHFLTAVGVEQVTLTLPGTGDQSPKDCKLQYSDDGSAWSDAFSFSLADYVQSQTRTVPETLAAGFHRSWRLIHTAVDGATHTQLDELEFRATSGGADQTANVGSGGSASGRVTRSAQAAGNEAWRVFDNTTGSWFISGVTSGWVAFIFPAAVKVEEILMKASTNPTRTPKDFKLEYSDNGGGTWTTQKTFASQTGWSANETRVLAAI